ncbi:MAG: SGNH/GDSL hydrolase family protein, partial [Endomicrobia bacterium]|nr:SGNH/GDSL hydrolase family protein [Endomicrobiia bacterium]
DVNPASSTVFTADTSKMGDGSISASYEGVMSSSITFAINKPIKGRKIMLCGNSILQSGPSPSIGWLNNHGMAASSPEKDYAHILQKNINDMFGPYEYNLFNIAPFERDCTHEPPYDYSSLFSYIINEVKRFDPDVVSLQLGENVPGAITAIGYQNALEQLITAIRTARPGVQVLLCTSFWGGVTVPGAQQAAAALHVPLVELHPLNLPQYKALDEYEHAGVAMHPNDAGMEEIANRIFSAMLTIL